MKELILFQVNEKPLQSVLTLEGWLFAMLVVILLTIIIYLIPTFIRMCKKEAHNKPKTISDESFKWFVKE